MTTAELHAACLEIVRQWWPDATGFDVDPGQPLDWSECLVWPLPDPVRIEDSRWHIENWKDHVALFRAYHEATATPPPPPP